MIELATIPVRMSGSPVVDACIHIVVVVVVVVVVHLAVHEMK